MIKIGIDYYPEHWDEAMWEPDLQRMKETGAHVVRIGEFAWGRLEPEDGNFRFDWLDRAIRAIAEKGMQVILGTPTNCAPLWLYRGHPETLVCDAEGRRSRAGIRGHRCMENPVFRRYAERIVGELARRYAANPAVLAWQIDNELESNLCTCPSCTAAFRRWLRQRYGSLERLNAAWRTDVWSGEIGDWEEIELARDRDSLPQWYNPAFMLDRERFGAESVAGFVEFQCGIIRQIRPDAIITTNACFGTNLPDFHREFRRLDVAAYDNYPPVRFPDDPEAIYSNAFALDFVRGFKRNNYWILEQLGGPMGGWGPINPALEPGMLESYALQAVAHGANLVSFFRWRTATGGAEMFCHGILDHNNRPNRRLAELKSLCERLSRLPKLDATGIKSRVAILYSADQEYAFKNQFQAVNDSYWTQLQLFHYACMSLGVGTDVIHESAETDGYQVIIVPTHVITSPDLVARLEEQASLGATVVITNRSGVKDQNGNCILGMSLPTAFSALCGCHVVECDAIGAAVQHIRTVQGGIYEISGWCDLLELDTAEEWAHYKERFYAGVPAIARNRWGKGQVYYLGTIGRKALYQTLLLEIFREQKIPVMETLPAGVEVCTRTDGEDSYRFFFNNTRESQTVLLEKARLHLEPLEVKIQVNRTQWI